MKKFRLNQNGFAPVAIIAIIIAVLAIGGVAYVVTDGFGTKSDDSSASTTSQDSSDQAEQKSGSGAEAASLIAKAMSSGSGVVCNYENTVDKFSGVVFIKGDRYRMDYEETEDDGVELGHMIMRDKVTYVWADGDPRGFKIDARDLKNEDGESISENSFNGLEPEDIEKLAQQENPNDKISCQEGGVDDSRFDLPSDVQFADFNSFFTGESSQ